MPKQMAQTPGNSDNESRAQVHEAGCQHRRAENPRQELSEDPPCAPPSRRLLVQHIVVDNLADTDECRDRGDQRPVPRRTRSDRRRPTRSAGPPPPRYRRAPRRQSAASGSRDKSHPWRSARESRRSGSGRAESPSALPILWDTKTNLSTSQSRQPAPGRPRRWRGRGMLTSCACSSAFRLTKNRTTVRTEIPAGVTTFLTDGRSPSASPMGSRSGSSPTRCSSLARDGRRGALARLPVRRALRRAVCVAGALSVRSEDLLLSARGAGSRIGSSELT